MVNGIEAKIYYHLLKKEWINVIESGINLEKIGDITLQAYLCQEIQSASSTPSI